MGLQILSLEANMRFDMLIATIDQWSHVSLLPEAREIAPFREQNMFHKFLRNAGFHLTTRNPSMSRLRSFLDIYALPETLQHTDCMHAHTHTHTKGVWSVAQCYSTCWPLG